MRGTVAAALALGCGAVWAQAAAFTPADSASLARATALAAGVANSKASIAAPARAAAFGAALAEPLPSLPRKPPYPPGLCTSPCPLPPRAPCRACTPGAACPSKVYPGSRASRNYTYCVNDFRRTCADPLNEGCAACNLFRDVSARCTPGAPSPSGCVDRGDYAWLPAREELDVDTNGTRPLLCACETQWLLVPTTPCTGVEAEDPACTGSAAERWWAFAFREAAGTGLFETKVDGSAPERWAVVVNAANRRSQHQTHLRVGRLNPSLPPAFGDLMDRWRATRAFSPDPLRPTITTPSPASIGPDPKGEVQAPLVATVFVPGGVAVAKPWQTGAVVAAAAPGGASRPYGILASPWAQAGLPGVTVSAIFDVGSTQLLIEDARAGDCVAPCYVWEGEDAGSGLAPLGKGTD